MKHRGIRKNLIIPFWIMTISVIVLTIIMQLVINDSLQDMKADVKFEEVASEQRVRSSEIIKDLAAERLSNEVSKGYLDSLAHCFYKVQNAMLADSKLLDQSYYIQARALNVTYNNFMQLLNVTLYNNSINYSIAHLSELQKIYLNQLNKFIITINKYSNKKIRDFKVTQAVAMLIALCIIILEAFLIVLPAIKKVGAQNKHLRAIAFHHSHIVRSPLANIIGILSIADLEEDAEARHTLFTQLKTEASKLDAILHETVKETTF